MVDQNKEGEGHDYIGISQLTVSPDNKMLAWTMDTTGKDMWAAHIKNLETGEKLKEEVIPRVMHVEWANDGQTLFYTVPDELMRPHKVILIVHCSVRMIYCRLLYAKTNRSFGIA